MVDKDLWIPVLKCVANDIIRDGLTMDMIGADVLDAYIVQWFKRQDRMSMEYLSSTDTRAKVLDAILGLLKT
ncbi:MAG: hypothetical protein ACRCXB_15070 [Aeromonadaceae bacterium]